MFLYLYYYFLKRILIDKFIIYNGVFYVKFINGFKFKKKIVGFRKICCKGRYFMNRFYLYRLNKVIKFEVLKDYIW